jgi:hypothetical protein
MADLDDGFIIGARSTSFNHKQIAEKEKYYIKIKFKSWNWKNFWCLIFQWYIFKYWKIQSSKINGEKFVTWLNQK